MKAPFPFPALEEGSLKQRIRSLGERLDAHRKRQQEQHPGLTLTGIYNVLEKLRAGEPLTAKDKQIHDQGLVTLLKQLHDELDAAVFEAYGWSDLHIALSHLDRGELYDPATDTITRLDTAPGAFEKIIQEEQSRIEQELLTRLVTLNHERAAEEKRGLIRWLRPDYQCGGDHRSPQQSALPGTEAASSQSKIQNQQSSIGNPSTPWPAKLPAQVTLIRQLLTTAPTATAEQLSTHFGRKNLKRTEQIEGILETLKGLGQM